MNQQLVYSLTSVYCNLNVSTSGSNLNIFTFKFMSYSVILFPGEQNIYSSQIKTSIETPSKKKNHKQTNKNSKTTKSSRTTNTYDKRALSPNYFELFALLLRVFIFERKKVFVFIALKIDRRRRHGKRVYIINVNMHI